MRKSAFSIFVLAVSIAATTLTTTVAAEGFTPWPEVLKMADANQDGKVSPHEVMFFESAEHFVGFQPFMADHFQDFDADNDGVVSLDECRSGLDKLGMSDAQISQAFFERQGFMPRSNP